MNDLLLLALLLEGPQHGYALKKKVGLITGHGEMHNNLVYPLLKRFVGQGWVSRRTVEGERGQRKELYALTAKGRQELVRSLGEFDEKAAGSADAFRLRVGLFSLLDRETRESILNQRTDWLERRAENVKRLVEATGAPGWSAEVLGFLKAEVEAETKWVERLRRKAGRQEREKGRK